MFRSIFSKHVMIGFACGLFGVNGAAIGQGDVWSLECSFTHELSREYGHRRGQPGEMDVSFESEPDGRFFMVGNVNRVPVELFVNDRTVNVLQKAPGGSVVLTTVFAGGEAVMSRHVLIANQKALTTWFGRCQGGWK